ncbi:MAG: glycosyltransferase family 4 protein [Psychromonas sp.]|nr:glycosyltransferase family 4 protein [Alteromonadales bacterium]MCP5079822.1 glycosyltransferase family 4 protein [Psychromonas sp.]
MKKIAYVLASYPVLSETFVGTEMRNMQLCGHDIQPIAFHRHQGQYQEQDQALKEQTLFLSEYSKLCALKGLAYIDLGILKAIKFSLLQQGLPFKSLIASALKLVYLAKKNNCTHFHAHFAQGAAATAIVAARLCGATVSFVGHGYDIYATPQDLELKLNSVDFAIAVCEDMVNDFKQLAPNVNVSLVYCGVELDRFNNHHSSITEQNAITAESIRNVQCKKNKLLFIGRLCETKGLFTLLHALQLLPKTKRPVIDFVGDGVLKDDLQQFVAENHLTEHVNFLGAKQSTWFIGNSHHYDAMVVPFELASNGDRDTGPVVVKEAMALKLPVITTYFMGCKEFITDSTGLHVPPKNPPKLAEAITQFYAMSSLEIQSLKENAYHRVRELYSAKIQADNLSSVIEQHRNA